MKKYQEAYDSTFAVARKIDGYNGNSIVVRFALDNSGHDDKFDILVVHQTGYYRLESGYRSHNVEDALRKLDQLPRCYFFVRSL